MSAQPSETPSIDLLDAWLRGMGFAYDPLLGRVRNPFDFLRAEDDPALTECFVSLLDPDLLLRPTHIAVLALPGAGKTVLRKMAELYDAKVRRGEIRVREEIEQQNSERRAILRKIIAERFNESELRDLCFELKVDYYNELGGKTKLDKARELIFLLEWRQNLTELAKVGKRLRPDIPWDTVLLPSGLTSELLPYTSPLELATDLEGLLLRRQVPGPTSSFGAVSVLLDATECSETGTAESAVLSILQRIPRREFYQRGVFFKLLLPLHFKPFVESLPAFELSWTPETLRSFLASRFLWASRGHLSRLAQLCDDRLLAQTDPDQYLASISITPRRLLQIGQLLLQQSALKSRWNPLSSTVMGDRIGDEIWQQCIKQAKQIPLEIAPQQVPSGAGKEPGAPSASRPSRSMERPSNSLHLVLWREGTKIRVRLQEDSDEIAEPGLKLGRPPAWNDDFDVRRDWGQRLYSALLRGRVEKRFEEVVYMAAKSAYPGAIHLHLHFANDKSRPMIAQYPWEWIHDRAVFLVQTRRVEIIRHWSYRNPKIPANPLSIKLPLRVLYLAPRPKMGSQDYQDDANTYDWLQLSALQKDGLIELNVLSGEELTFEGFEQYLRKSSRELRNGVNIPVAHVFHFDGHGRLGRRCLNCNTLVTSDSRRCSNPNCRNTKLEKPAGYLIFHQAVDNRKPFAVHAAKIGEALADSGIRLAILSACSSAAYSGVTAAADSVASQLVLTGVNGAIGMQWEVDGKRTGEFMQNFYRYLTESRLSVIDALTFSRSALGIGNDWATPALYLQPDDENGCLFEIRR